MAEQSIYVFTSPAAEVGFCERAVRLMTDAGLLSPSSEPLVQLAERLPGDDAARFLPQRFEYLGVRIAPFPALIPEDPAIEPRCPHCSADLRDAWYSTINDAFDVDAPHDWTLLRVACSGCSKQLCVDEVRDEAGVGAFLRREFVFFDDVNLSAADFERFEETLRTLLGHVEIRRYVYT